MSKPARRLGLFEREEMLDVSDTAFVVSPHRCIRVLGGTHGSFVADGFYFIRCVVDGKE